MAQERTLTSCFPLQIMVDSISDFSDSAGFLDKTDPLVEYDRETVVLSSLHAMPG